MIEETLEIGQGMVVVPGHIIGRYSFCRDDFKVGDIILRSMTSVEDIEYMEQCSGIATTLGGLTCHAAINARPYGKPTVVGIEGLTRFWAKLMNPKYFTNRLLEINHERIRAILSHPNKSAD